MTPEQMPPVGAFLRPVGRGYAYCMRVVKVWPTSKDSPRITIEYERWGLENETPVRDGHQNYGWNSDLVPALPGVWRDEWPHQTPRWSCCPLYYRLMDTGPKGQMELLA